MATTPSSHEELQEQNRLLRAQVRLLQANCQWLSSCNETLVDFYSTQDAAQPIIPFSNPYDSLLQQQNLAAVGNVDAYPGVLDSTFNQANSVPDFELPTQQNILPFYAGVSTLRNPVPHPTSTSHPKQRIRQNPKRPLESSSLWPDNATNLTTTEEAAQTVPSSHSNNTDDVLAPLPADFVSSVDDVHRLPVFNESAATQIFRSNPETISNLNEPSSSHTTDQLPYETGTNSLPVLPDGDLSLGRAPLLEVRSVESADPIPEKGTQALVPRAALGEPLILQPQWTPDLQHLSTATCTGGFLDHYIYALRDFMHRLDGGGASLLPKQRNKIMAKGVLWAVHEAWPQAEHFWKTTASFQGFLQCEVWRNFPIPSVYQSMHPAYKPTAVQLSIPHSPVVDWLPWPDLRDKIILSQDQIDVDLVCKTAIQHVVAHRRATPQVRPQKRVRRDIAGNSRSAPKTSFRVWDLCALEEADGQKPQQGTSLTYRPKSASVRALEKAYALECADFETQRLHPDFFATFPTLYCESVVSDYTVQELPSLRNRPAHDVLAAPQPMSTAAVARLETLGLKMLKAGA